MNTREDLKQGKITRRIRMGVWLRIVIYIRDLLVFFSYNQNERIQEASEGLGFGSSIFDVAHLAREKPSYFPGGCAFFVLVGIKVSPCFVRLSVWAGRSRFVYLFGHFRWCDWLICLVFFVFVCGAPLLGVPSCILLHLLNALVSYNILIYQKKKKRIQEAVQWEESGYQFCCGYW